MLCEVEKLNDGFSDAVVYRVRVVSKNGSTRFHAVAKIGSSNIVNTEVSNYEDEISRLPQNATPRILGQLSIENCNLHAVFYGLARGYDKTFFDAVDLNHQITPTVVQHLEQYFHPWRNGVPMERKTIYEVRKTLLSDVRYSKIIQTYGLDWAIDFEKEVINSYICTTHGDLHGSNILVDDEGRPVVIDYGDVGLRTSSMDAITLELSTHFHPSGTIISTSISPDVAKNWGTNEYIDKSSISEVPRSCFAWAESVSAGRREIAASAYSYLIWQLKFNSTNKEKIINFLEGVRKYYSNT